MNGSKQLVEGALRMKNLMRPGPIEARAALGRPAVPPPLAQAHRSIQPVAQPAPPVQLATPMFAPAEPQRRSVYMDLMKKHDSLNPRIKI